MLADDELGATRESPEDLEPYLRAFAAIENDPNQLLVVADHGSGPVGVLQLSIIPGMSRRGSTRGLIEGVRIATSHRGTGLGTALVQWAIEKSRQRGCALVQLTSDTTRTDAHRFYEHLGFQPTHTGFKLTL